MLETSLWFDKFFIDDKSIDKRQQGEVFFLLNQIFDENIRSLLQGKSFSAKNALVQVFFCRFYQQPYERTEQQFGLQNPEAGHVFYQRLQHAVHNPFSRDLPSPVKPTRCKYKKGTKL